MTDALLVLEDGTSVRGRSFGAEGEDDPDEAFYDDPDNDEDTDEDDDEDSEDDEEEEETWQVDCAGVRCKGRSHRCYSRRRSCLAKK